ncbi:MAG: nodulation protein NfeD [Deltaproteobacteria bacterium]|nr:nodulation protein NfeD [Deltaproteobacteria bacterium]
MKTIRVYLIILIALTAAWGTQAEAPGRRIYVLPAVGSINPGLAEFVVAGIQKAEKAQAEAVVIQLDTPGGLDSSMRQICQAIINAKAPVIVYVSPRGGRAASAGVLITMAAHVAAMAPGTNIGAAHPVSVGMGKVDKVMGEKMVNDMAAYGRALAEERGRNADWVDKAIRKSVSISAPDALKQKVIEVMAENLEDLLRKVDGRRVMVAGKTLILKTTGVVVEEIPEDLRTKVLKHIADPNIAFILMMLGLAGLYFELAHPGVVLPGVVGALCLLLAFFAFQTLPVNFIGILLIILAFILFILEFTVTSYGLLTVSGIASLLLGSIMLFRGGETGVDISWGVLIPTVLIVSLFFILVTGIVFRSHLRRSMTGAAGMVGEKGVAHTDLKPEGQVFIFGEYWHAVAREPVAKGEAVEVVQVKDLKLVVKKVSSEQ